MNKLSQLDIPLSKSGHARKKAEQIGREIARRGIALGRAVQTLAE